MDFLFFLILILILFHKYVFENKNFVFANIIKTHKFRW